MARLARANHFAPEEIAIVHVFNRVVRRCFLLGDDPVTGKNYDHRKAWIEELIKLQAKFFAVDVLAFSILSNHFHQILRSRPDVVATWDDTEVARRWLMICPQRKGPDGLALEPNEAELNSIRTDLDKLKMIRSRLSDISWWMRLLCQKIGQRANAEEKIPGKFWESRFKAVRILDEQALLACAAYVDLNPIRAALAELLEDSDHTSIQRRIVAMQEKAADTDKQRSDGFLAPLTIDERRDALGPYPHRCGERASDKGFLAMSLESYIQLLDWTARQIVPGRRGSTPEPAPAVLERLQLDAPAWCELVRDFGRLFSLVAGRPRVIDAARSRGRKRRFTVPHRLRELLHE
ncbi:hypothetical protein [Aureliella helgolandensis]|uniref:Transposase IS200-like domain-containing protein n=1 Tax=Aureliella helgolandensis TaxID=2527968 RepID=A0A518G884_9BACT|nr:hypothetical protein [Aureliella helgolandensis]QDV24802.1 hypothetical protein Q31a_31240 [Aureliella helgolandensis]